VAHCSCLEPGLLSFSRLHQIVDEPMSPIVATFIGICLAASIACGSNQPSGARQDNQPHDPADQRTLGDVTPQQNTKFTVTMMFDGFTKSGARLGGTLFETPIHSTVSAETVYLHSHEDAEKEFDDWIKLALKVIEQGKVQNMPEERAVVTVRDMRGCEVATQILFTSGRLLRVISSCSSDDALEFEKQASRETNPPKR
jgi:hypothetical protein